VSFLGGKEVQAAFRLKVRVWGYGKPYEDLRGG